VKHSRIEWGSSEVWNGNVKGVAPEDTSAVMGRGSGRNGRSDELGETLMSEAFHRRSSVKRETLSSCKG